MYSGSDSYIGGVKISDNRDLDVHSLRPDEYGYRALRHVAKPENGTTKEARAAYKDEHERLNALWQEHCPARISKDDAWKALGSLGTTKGRLIHPHLLPSNLFGFDFCSMPGN